MIYYVILSLIIVGLGLALLKLSMDKKEEEKEFLKKVSNDHLKN